MVAKNIPIPINTFVASLATHLMLSAGSFTRDDALFFDNMTEERIEHVMEAVETVMGVTQRISGQKKMNQSRELPNVLATVSSTYHEIMSLLEDISQEQPNEEEANS
ncbi:hypothetical protein KKF84_03645 [Myxococcota bacterium]|nr:hypothetical protein [Myxococcota bacterium]